MIRHLLPSILAAALLAAAPASAAVRLGVVAPQGDDSFAMLGDQLRQGIGAYQSKAGKPFEQIVTEPETCDAASGTAAAKAMIKARVDVVVGFLCPESLNAALPLLSQAGIATIGTSVRADILMEEPLKKNWPFFRLAPTASDEIGRITGIIEKQWAGEPFALVEDGTIYGRDLVENVRVALEAKGITAAFIDTYRPAQDKQFGLAHRLQRSGATHVLVGGDRSDVAIIARDCASLGLKLTIMGGESMKAPPDSVPLQSGVLGVMVPDAASLPSASDALAVLKTLKIGPVGDTLVGYAAAEIVDQAGKARNDNAAPLADALSHGTFHTALGDIRFTDKHERADNPFELMVWNGEKYVPEAPGGKGSAE